MSCREQHANTQNNGTNYTNKKARGPWLGECSEV